MREKDKIVQLIEKLELFSSRHWGLGYQAWYG